MKTVIKNVLLGSVAGLAMVGTAAAADLPVKAKAAEYVKICSTYGAGFYYIPGTDTCLKVGGYVTADTYFTDIEGKTRVTVPGVSYRLDNDPDGQSYFLTRVGVQLDARTQTEYGTLRSYFEGRFNAGESYGFGQEIDTGEFSFSDGIRNSAEMKYGYIQFAGFTFGRATSAFDFWAGDGWQGIQPGSFYSDVTLNVIQYTADFGNGFSATIALEDSYGREDEFANFEELSGQQVPDIVGNIAYEGTWGAFKVSGAWHQIGDWNPLVGPDFGNGPTSLFTSNDDSGWAVLAGVRFDFAETTTLYVEGAYASGAPGYLGLDGTIPVVDAFGRAVEGWYVGGSLIHYWTPSVFTTVVGSYTQSDNFAVGYDIDVNNNTNFTGVSSTDFTGYNVGVNIGWVPVKGLTLVLQYDYLNAEYSGSDFLYGNVTPISYSQEAAQNRVTFSAKRSF
ncbi:polymerase [Ancylobacter dichloromethanicus]|uniref:Porin n=1 Tax=Ancylobacter dichloromethanicus TaxID=518825 RepID=A0A9W6N043_9HYPH|nr:polymerase [Ancylobacter dichloromethanicus]